VPLPIEDYALIGDCETAALVGRDGSIDWLCIPRFDSDACFAALLGGPENGRWLIAPAAEEVRASRRYRGNTLILETTFETSDGKVLLVDFMPPESEGCDLMRLVIGLDGEVRSAIRGTARDVMGAVGNGAGLPAVAVPNGFGPRGLPTSLQFMGRAWEESTVLAAARAYQSRTDWHERHPTDLI